MCRGTDELRQMKTDFVKVPLIFQRLLINNAAHRVLLHLMSCSEKWNPSYAEIYRNTGLGVREVQRAIKFLIKVGLIRQLTVGCKIKKLTSTYDISNLTANIEKYIESQEKAKGRCLYPEPESVLDNSVNPATLSA